MAAMETVRRADNWVLFLENFQLSMSLQSFITSHPKTSKMSFQRDILSRYLYLVLTIWMTHYNTYTGENMKVQKYKYINKSLYQIF